MHKITQTGEGVYDIILTRGDTLTLTVGMKVNGQSYTPTTGSIRFAMKGDFTDETPILEKTIPLNSMTLVIEPTDTKTLPMDSKYVFDIQYTDQTGNIDTFIEGTFTVSHEVD